MDRKLRAAAVHAAPVFMNKVATMRKVVELVKKAKEDAIELLVFPETFVPGYPVSEIHRCECSSLMAIVFYRMLFAT